MAGGGALIMPEGEDEEAMRAHESLENEVRCRRDIGEMKGRYRRDIGSLENEAMLDESNPHPHLTLTLTLTLTLNLTLTLTQRGDARRVGQGEAAEELRRGGPAARRASRQG